MTFQETVAELLFPASGDSARRIPAKVLCAQTREVTFFQSRKSRKGSFYQLQIRCQSLVCWSVVSRRQCVCVCFIIVIWFFIHRFSFSWHFSYFCILYSWTNAGVGDGSCKCGENIIKMRIPHSHVESASHSQSRGFSVRRYDCSAWSLLYYYNYMYIQRTVMYYCIV